MPSDSTLPLRLDAGCCGGIIRFMTDGFVLDPGQGEPVSPAMTLKVGDKYSPTWSMFEVVNIGSGFDVGAHLHRNAEELFYVLEGQLDLLAFEPRVRTSGNWQSWESHTGATVARGGPGSMMYVPRGCPHAFANPGPGPARMIFLVSPAGHEHYQKELAELVASTTGSLDAAIAELRARHDIEQLTPQIIPGRQ
jgi:oxalate decarboxylase/phosphoglucose isomerase-like protein (cupin superfamily)